jgi:uroporphyrinogen decarboxylase
MPQSSRELVSRCVTFRHPDRVPRDLWTLPWAESRFPREIAELRDRFPPDIAGAPDVHEKSSRRIGSEYVVGRFVDEWGCAFENIQAGVVGEVKQAAIREIDDWKAYEPPYEILPRDPKAARDRVNAFCAGTTRYVLSGCAARPWERLQFLRTTAEAMLDVAAPDERVRGLIRTIHEFNLRELEFWAKTDVDALFFMDDWGAQRQLLIPPATWRELFKPLYRDYCAIARAHGKAAFMHTDGYIAEVYSDLVEIGVSAVNSQLFAMDMDALGRTVKGRIVFWGEIDRQHVLTAADPEEGRRAVRKVADALYDPSGGVIAQFELGAGANPAVARAIYEEWEAVGAREPTRRGSSGA